MDSKLHIDNVLNARLRPLYEKAAARIDAIPPGEKIPATKLAEEIGKDIGMTGPQIYPLLRFLFEDFPGVTVKRGAQGGIFKNIVVPVAELPEADASEPEESDSEESVPDTVAA